MADWTPVQAVAELNAGTVTSPATDGPYGVAAGDPSPLAYQPAAYASQYPQNVNPQGPAGAFPQQLGYATPVANPGAPVPGAYYAGFWWRFLAIFIDGLILMIPNWVIGMGLEAVFDTLPQSRRTAPAMMLPQVGLPGVLQLVVGWLYSALQESSAAQATLGKRICGLVVTDVNGARLTFARATGRYFAKIVSYITLYIGFLMAAFTQRKQALHDTIAGTQVWKKP